jgi:hypothetical protein
MCAALDTTVSSTSIDRAWRCSQPWTVDRSIVHSAGHDREQRIERLCTALVTTVSSGSIDRA